MSRFLAFVICVFVFCGCKQPQKTGQQNYLSVNEMVEMDTIDISLSDSLQMQEIFNDKTFPEAKQMHESFDDFLIAFASDSLLQKERIQFPLDYIHNDETNQLHETSWKYDDLFLSEGCYTLLFDNEDDLEAFGDTLQSEVSLDWYLLNEDVCKRFLFVSEQGKWTLKRISEEKRKKTKSDFVDFYTRFVNDSIYQRNHICLPLEYVTLDPDDEFSILETSLDMEQWFAFKPLLPITYLSNIDYGQQNEETSPIKILRVNGIGNGYTNVYYFRRLSSVWELYRYEDTSM